MYDELGLIKELIVTKQTFEDSKIVDISPTESLSNFADLSYRNELFGTFDQP